MENEKRLTLFRNSQSITKLEQRQQLDLIVNFQSEIHSFLEIEKVLESINQRYFENRGKIGKIDQNYQLNTESTINRRRKQSRFDAFFSTKSNLAAVFSGIDLEIAGELLKKQNGIKSIRVEIYQNIDLEKENYEFLISGVLSFYNKRSYDGNWNEKAIILYSLGQDLTISFPLNNPPLQEELSLSLTQNIEEILDEFVKQGFINPPKTEDQNSSNTTSL